MILWCFTLQGTNISHQWERKLIFPTAFGWDMLVPGSVTISSFDVFFLHFEMMIQMDFEMMIRWWIQDLHEPSGLARNTLLRTRTTRPWMAQETPKDCWLINKGRTREKRQQFKRVGHLKKVQLVWLHPQIWFGHPKNSIRGICNIKSLFPRISLVD